MPPPVSTSPHPLKGIALMIGAFAFFAGLDACAKYLSSWHETPQIVWARYVGHFALALLVFAPRAGPGVWRTGNLRLQLVRSALLVCSTFLNFLALRFLQLAETSAISFTIPIWVVLLAGPLLKESISTRQWIGIGIGLVGVLIITRPGFGLLHGAVAFSLISAATTALYQITTRRLAGIDHVATTQLYTASIGALVVTPLAPLFWTTPASAEAVIAMVSIGLLGGVGHYLLILAHQHAAAPVLAPFSYTQILWMILLGYILFSDLPDRWTLAGAAVVVASGFYLAYRVR